MYNVSLDMNNESKYRNVMKYSLNLVLELCREFEMSSSVIFVSDLDALYVHLLIRTVIIYVIVSMI